MINSPSDEQLINSSKQDKVTNHTAYGDCIILLLLHKSVPQPMSALPEYMTPAEASKEVELLGKQQVRCLCDAR